MSDPADLLRVLARVRVARPAELQAVLGLSRSVGETTTGRIVVLAACRFVE